ncbi:MAG: YadA-like family protein [Dialister micraerophilus]|nr:YadA-like family protein [Dialister micraerophilus]
MTAKTVKADEYKVGDKTYINKDGINANGNKITNVGDGVVSKESTDAVNGKQLFATNQMIANNMNQINNLREESREGDALGAAMAALKPLDFDPYQRSQVMAGVGYYRGKEAIALGLAYYSNENTLLHAGLSYAGSSELMANAGISYRFGSRHDRKLLEERNKLMPQYKDGVISSVYVMQDEMVKLQKENEILKEKNAKAEAENKEMRSELEILKKQVSKLMEKI